MGVEPLSLRRLRQLATVGDCGSIVAAARLLHLSAPALSASMKELEASVGVSLLVRRSGEGVSLTPEGARLVTGARELLGLADELQHSVTADIAGGVAPVTVGSLVTFAPFVLPRIVNAHRRRDPDVDVMMRAAAQDELIELLSAGAIHLAVTYDIELSHRVAFEAVASAAPHVVLPVDHPLAGEASVRLRQLADEPLIGLDLALSREYFVSLFLHERVNYDPRERVRDIELARCAVGNGLGWSLVNLVPPHSMAVDGSEVAYVPLRTRHPPLRLGIASLRDRRQPASVAAVGQTIREVLGELTSR